MALDAVEVTTEVWLTCATHALSTETEEVMGLLLGDIAYGLDAAATAHVWAAAPQTRSDRRKDRVETNPEQLAAATAQAEISSTRMRLCRSSVAATNAGCALPPIGPPTTRHDYLDNGAQAISRHRANNARHRLVPQPPAHHCLPIAHVRTQGMYQMMDDGFVGLIFSCFSEDSNKVGRIQATAFQSEPKRKSTAGLRLPSSNIILYPGAGPAAASPPRRSLSPISTSLRSSDPTESDGDVAVLGGSQLGDQAQPTDISFTDALRVGDTSDAELSASFQEAVHRSNMDASEAEFVCKEVPLRVVKKAQRRGAQEQLALWPLVSLQRILFAEEQAAYKAAMAQSVRKSDMHAIAVMHHNATYQASLCKLMEFCLVPMLSTLWDRQQQNVLRLALLQAEAAELQDMAASHSLDALAPQAPGAVLVHYPITAGLTPPSSPPQPMLPAFGGFPPQPLHDLDALPFQPAALTKRPAGVGFQPMSSPKPISAKPRVSNCWLPLGRYSPICDYVQSGATVRGQEEAPQGTEWVWVPAR
eukprot:SM000255S08770  [mRNA]  locus=s255:132396:136671:+ [translate_table: standard]